MATVHTRHPILILPPDVAERIAAGEVIERPVSVVKELVENALDAGAHEVRVEIRGGGLRLMRVTDDGYGIPEDELERACARHTTSKISTVEDLNFVFQAFEIPPAAAPTTETKELAAVVVDVACACDRADERAIDVR